MQLMRHFEQHTARLLGSCQGDAKAQLMALTREVCALKLNEGQLLANLAAATKRADAAQLAAQRLRAGVEAAQVKVDALQGPAAEGQQHEGELMLQVAQLSAQAAAASQEQYRQKDALLQAQQVGGLPGLGCWVCCFCPPRPDHPQRPAALGLLPPIISSSLRCCRLPASRVTSQHLER